MNYKLTISYDGTDFFGWQRQKNGRTIQEEIENSLIKIFKTDSINLIGSGRTDSGVHALRQVANFKVNTKMNEEQIQLAINAIICKDIRITNCKIVDDNFHSRYSAIKRKYIYKISQETSPFNMRYSWHIYNNIKYDLLVELAKLVIGKKDFSNFCKNSSMKENNKCEIFESEWIFKNSEFQYEICGNRFLHHMVRMLVGTMIEVSKNKISVNQFEDMINLGNPKPVFTAPPNGLFLSKIYYK